MKIDLDPLHDAYIATDDVGEGNLILSLIQSIETESPFPRQFYESSEAGPYCSSTTYKALGKVLESVDKADRLLRGEGVRESRGKKMLDFSVEPVDLVLESGEGSFVPTKKPRSKRAKPAPKLLARRKAALVALRRMRGLPDSEVICLSSDEEPEKEEGSSPPSKKAVTPVQDCEVHGPPMIHNARQMNQGFNPPTDCLRNDS